MLLYEHKINCGSFFVPALWVEYMCEALTKLIYIYIYMYSPSEQNIANSCVNGGLSHQLSGEITLSKNTKRKNKQFPW